MWTSLGVYSLGVDTSALLFLSCCRATGSMLSGLSGGKK